MTPPSSSLAARLTRSFPLKWLSGRPVVPVVRLSGPIGLSMPLRSSLTFAGVASLLERAFSMKGAKAVALVINSPGGSPVQSHLIYKRIRALAEEKAMPVHAFIEDVGASGAYMLACAGDEIVADPSSIVGSIGVVSPGFGFDRLIERLGIDRRVYASGERKVTADPFQPEREEDVARIRVIQRDVHDGFIALVRSRRGARLGAPDDVLFTGEFWTGFRALELGLIDRLGDLRSVMRDAYGEHVDLRIVAPRKGFLGRRSLGAREFSGGVGEASLAENLLGALEARMLWSRFGL